RVWESTGTRRVEALHQVGARAEGPGRQPAAEVRAERRQVRRDAEHLLEAAGRQPGGHHLVEDEQHVVRGRRLAKGLEERALTGYHTARPLERLDDDGGELMRVLSDQAGSPLGVVVLRDDEGERRIDRRAGSRLE